MSHVTAVVVQDPVLCSLILKYCFKRAFVRVFLDYADESPNL